VPSAREQENRYQSTDDTIVQLFTASASALITRVARSNRDAHREEQRRTIWKYWWSWPRTMYRSEPSLRKEPAVFRIRSS